MHQTYNGINLQYAVPQFLPFGEVRWGYFNAKEFDEENGMYYYSARYYAPPTFISRDPLMDEKPWLSPYHYCSNNPVNKIDPTGMLDGDPDKNGMYTIAKGDNFWNLEKEWGIAHGTLQKLNPSVNPNNLQIGQQIVAAVMVGELMVVGNDANIESVDPMIFAQPLPKSPQIENFDQIRMMFSIVALRGISIERIGRLFTNVKNSEVQIFQSLGSGKGWKSLNQISQLIIKKNAPKSMIALHVGRTVHELPHIHFKGEHALYINGVWKHGGRVLTNEEIKFLIKYGWTLPK